MLVWASTGLRRSRSTFGLRIMIGTLCITNAFHRLLCHRLVKTISMLSTLTVSGKTQIVNKCCNTKQTLNDHPSRSYSLATTTTNRLQPHSGKNPLRVVILLATILREPPHEVITFHNNKCNLEPPQEISHIGRH